MIKEREHRGADLYAIYKERNHPDEFIVAENLNLVRSRQPRHNLSTAPIDTSR